MDGLTTSPSWCGLRHWPRESSKPVMFYFVSAASCYSAAASLVELLACDLCGQIPALFFAAVPCTVLCAISFLKLSMRVYSALVFGVCCTLTVRFAVESVRRGESNGQWIVLFSIVGKLMPPLLGFPALWVFPYIVASALGDLLVIHLVHAVHDEPGDGDLFGAVLCSFFATSAVAAMHMQAAKTIDKQGQLLAQSCSDFRAFASAMTSMNVGFTGGVTQG
mmetsp:Transcript_31756/g.87739  ORF Transcript_31756/g.87739 Transcript_31756/m.87739 type:complete len:221 (+) Transcript_31756:52-714(+)